MILDTNAVSALLAGDSALEGLLLREEKHQLPVIVIGEYRFGLLRSRYARRLEELLTTLISESEVLDVDEKTTIFYATIREELRAKGRPLPENDVWISALALQTGQRVVSRDQHFDHVEGLQRLSW